MTRWRDRSTADIVVLLLAVVVSTIIVVEVAGIVVIRAIDPDANITDIVESLDAIITTLVGALIGYIAGRGARPGTDLEQP